MPKKFCCYFSLKIGSIVIGTITTILCAAWLGYNLHQYFQTIKLQELHIIEVKVVLSATIFIISVTEIFGAYMENDWLILPWLLVCGSGLAISPLILFLMVLVNLNIIFSIIGYAISLYWWLCVLYYYQELCLQNEENVLNRFFGKFCEALSLIDFFIAYSTTPILSAPAQSEAHLDLIRDVQGRYKFTLTSSNVTRIQESFLNGSVKGSYSYLTSNKQRQTILYKTGFDGLTIEGKYLPGALGQEPEDLPEVLEAKRQFSIVSENVKKYFTVYGGDKPVVDLSTEGFLNVVSKQLDPGLKPVYSPKDGRI